MERISKPLKFGVPFKETNSDAEVKDGGVGLAISDLASEAVETVIEQPKDVMYRISLFSSFSGVAVTLNNEISFQRRRSARIVRMPISEFFSWSLFLLLPGFSSVTHSIY